MKQFYAGIMLMALVGDVSAQQMLPPQPSGTCPKGADPCKIISMTQDEINSLIGPGMILDQAEWANRSGMSGIASAWKQKIAQSPLGKKYEEPKKDEPKEEPKSDQ